MNRRATKLTGALEELEVAKAEFDRLLKQAMDHPEKTNRHQFWEAMKRVAVARRALGKIGAE